MKFRKVQFIVSLVALFALASCGGSSSSVVSSSEESSISSSSEPVIETISVASVRSLDVGASATLEGVVVAYNYTGQSTPYITGFWLADATGDIYIYGETVAQSVTPGNEVILSGTKAYYIPQTDSSSAEAVGYEGMLQLTSPQILYNDNSTENTIPSSVISDSTVADINQIPLTEDITGNVYRTTVHYHRYDSGSYVNYSIEDPNRMDSLLAYTQCNGKDYTWTDEWDGKTVDILFIVSLGKPSVGAWRICPVAIYGEETITDQQEANYGAKRALAELADVYSVDTSVTIPVADPALDGLTRSYSSSATQISISSDDTNNTIAITNSPIGVVTISATATYNGLTATASKSITLNNAEHFDTISIAAAKQMTDGSEVTIEAVVGQVTYKSSMTPQGLFVADDSGSFFVYNETDTQANLVGISSGNKVVLRGTITHYIKTAEYATAQNYTGDFQLKNAEVLNIDGNIYTVPSGAILTSTVADLVNTLPSTNLTSLIYSVSGVVLKTTSYYATAYYVASPDDTDVKLLAYSQNSGNDFSWLDDYVDTTVTILIGIQNLNLKASNSSWRICPISVVS